MLRCNVLSCARHLRLGCPTSGASTVIRTDARFFVLVSLGLFGLSRDLSSQPCLRKRVPWKVESTKSEQPIAKIQQGTPVVQHILHKKFVPIWQRETCRARSEDFRLHEETKQLNHDRGART